VKGHRIMLVIAVISGSGPDPALTLVSAAFRDYNSR
jgi:hypothetical protein